jgi:hemoglobin-like flavoprotein
LIEPIATRTVQDEGGGTDEQTRQPREELMPDTADAVTLIRASFARAVENEPALTERFYEILFERAPHLAALFRRERTEQARMLRDALVAVIDHLEDAAWLTGTLGTLGARHVGYGVTPAMYDDVGAALIATLAEACGADWSPAHAKAWATAYGAISTLMQQDTRAPPPRGGVAARSAGSSPGPTSRRSGARGSWWCRSPTPPPTSSTSGCSRSSRARVVCSPRTWARRSASSSRCWRSS